jgi:hypothetical protein
MLYKHVQSGTAHASLSDPRLFTEEQALEKLKEFKMEQNIPSSALDDYFNKSLDTIRALYLEQSNHYKLHKT